MRSVDGIPGLQLGRKLAGLPIERDRSKDNASFHQPIEGGMGMREWGRGLRWDVVGAFVLGLAVAQLAGLAERGPWSSL